jgi:hypothetical protein
MGIDLNRVIAVAIDTAFNEDQPRPHLARQRGVQALAAGAALATAARVAGRHRHRISKLGVAKSGLSKLADLSRLRDLPDALWDRLADHGFIHEDAESYEDEDYEGPEGEEDLDDEVDEEGPQDEGYEGPEGEEDLDGEVDGEEYEGSGPEDQEEVDYEDEEPEDEDEDAGQDSPNLIAVLGRHGASPPVLRRARTRVDPAARPPEPPRRDPGETRSRRRSNAAVDSGRGRERGSDAKGASG